MQPLEVSCAARELTFSRLADRICLCPESDALLGPDSGVVGVFYRAVLARPSFFTYHVQLGIVRKYHSASVFQKLPLVACQ